jgi:subtilisin family serine protease
MTRYALLALAGLLLAAPTRAAEISPELSEALAAGGSADALVFFRDQEPAPGSLMEDSSRLLPRLERNMAASRAVLAELLGPGAESQGEDLWISNAVAAHLDEAQVQVLSADDRVTRILLDEPVTVPQVTEVPASQALSEGDVTYGLEQLRVPEVRAEHGLTGAGVVVGHLDTGIDADHPDLVGKLKAYKNFRGWGSSPKDSNGHGTHTAATIAGGTSSGKSIGVAPGAKLVSGRVIGFGWGSSASGLIKGMQWMLNPDGKANTNDQPAVVSMSWHSGGGNQNPFYEALARYEAAGIIPSFSAGNSGQGGLTHPKEYPGNFVTAAVDSSGKVASFSSRGPTQYKGTEVKKPDWSAPGVAVYSAKTGGGYKRLSGTSMACPHASGVLALMLEADPSLTPSELRAILYETAVEAGSDGWDGSYGMGRLDAKSAIERVLELKAERLGALAPLDRELGARQMLKRLDLFSELASPF